MRYGCLWLALAAGGWGLLVATTGGVAWASGPVRFSSTDPVRPLAAALGCVLCHLLWFGRVDVPRVAQWLVPRLAPLAVLLRPHTLAIAGTMAVVVVGVVFGVDAVGGTDSYGYASQARLWRAGRLVVEQPFVGEWGWPYAAATATPPGYVATGAGGTVVPMYPPGFPLVLAAAESIGGAEAVFLVVPLLAGLAVWLTFLLGRRVGDDVVGLIAAFWLMTSPAFLFMLLAAPMSDIPAMTWWLLSVVLVLRDGRSGTLLLSGASAVLAILTRPNLAGLAVVMPALIGLRATMVGTAVSTAVSTAVRRGAVWMVPALVGPVVVAWLNNHLYGSPWASGYGPVADFFGWEYVGRNARLYASTLIESQTPVLVAALAAPLALAWAGRDRVSVATACWCLLFAAAVVGSYLGYYLFEAWFWTLRFVLPSYPMLLVAAAVTVVTVANRLRPAGLVVLGVLVVLVGRQSLQFANPEWLRAIAQQEYRYREAGEQLRVLPADAVVLAEMHSGSARYYANVVTLRFNQIDPLWLDRVVAELTASGRPVFAVLEPMELEPFRSRFSGGSALRWLQADPIEVTSRGVAIYAVAATASR